MYLETPAHSSFLAMTGFLLRDYDMVPNKELHGSLQVGHKRGVSCHRPDAAHWRSATGLWNPAAARRPGWLRGLLVPTLHNPKELPRSLCSTCQIVIQIVINQSSHAYDFDGRHIPKHPSASVTRGRRLPEPCHVRS